MSFAEGEEGDGADYINLVNRIRFLIAAQHANFEKQLGLPWRTQIIPHSALRSRARPDRAWTSRRRFAGEALI